MREIKPEDVPQLMRDGKLEFGMELEFKIYPDGDKWTERRPFIGFDARRSGGSAQFVTDGGWYHAARFPVTALRDGDPVVVNHGIPYYQFNAIFREFTKSGIKCYSDGLNNWTSFTKHSSLCDYDTWRLPTKKELSEAGYTEDQINEMMTRWGTETPIN